MNPQIQYARTEDSVSIAFTVIGSGSEVLVSAPGIPGDVHMYKVGLRLTALFDGLAGHGRRVVLHDSRNTGSSEHRDADYSIRARLASLEAVVDHVGVSQFSLYGHSHGCLTATAYAEEHPDRVKRLVLSHPFARGADYYSTVPEAATVVRLGAENMTAEEEDIYYQSMAGIFSGFRDPESAAKRAAAWRTSMSVDEWAAFREALLGSDVTDLLTRVSVPTLVVFSLQTVPALLPLTREVARLIPGAEFLEAVAQGSRMLNLDPVDAINDFLSKGEEEVAETPAPGGFVTILFTDMESSTTLTQQLGDAKAHELRRTHNAIVRSALNSNNGSEIKHTGDGIMASFSTASSALDAAIAIQRGVAKHKAANPDSPLAVYVGLNAGEPIAEDDDLFGTAVDLAARLVDHAEAGQILAANVVRELAAGKDYLFADLGETELRGFEDPVKLWQLRWQDG